MNSDNKRTPRPKIPPLERIALGVVDTANVLGVHPNTVRNLIRRGELPFVKVGRLKMISMEELKKLITPSG